MIVVAAIHGSAVPVPAATHLADLASDQEVVAVCGYPKAAPLLAAMRAALPRFELVGVVADPPTRVEGALLDSLLDQGALPVVVTAEERIAEVADWLAGRLTDAVRYASANPSGALTA